MRGLKVSTWIVLFCLVLITTSTNAQETTENGRLVPGLRAYKVNPHPPKIDGKLDDQIWQSKKMEFAKNFTQIEPDEGKAASESTLVAIAYDESALYVAFWCYDSEPDQVVKQLVRRDRSSEADRVTIRLDPFHDHQTGVAFEVNASGVQRDARYYNESNSDMSWDAVWESAVQSQPYGWSAEMRIPYHALRFAEKDIHTWGIDFIRYINRKNEVANWSFVPSEQGGFVSNFGHLTELKGIGPSSHLEVLPYIVSRAETEPKSIGNTDGKALLGNSGFDLKYALSSNLILNATINPDFGQVELDQPVLNLSTYETYFQEKRPFFLEGADLFRTEFNLFYSRRIGRTPFNGVSDSRAQYYTDYPNGTTILGAAKLTGKLAERTSIAFLTAVTQEEKAEYAIFQNEILDSVWNGSELTTNVTSRDTILVKGTVEPQGAYSVLRLKQDIFRNSFVGVMMTVAGQESYHPSVTGGFDWRLVTNNNKWSAKGQAIFSRVDPTNTGYGLDITFEKLSGKHIRSSVGYIFKDPELRLNKLGYTSRSDSKIAWAWLQYRTTDDWWIVRNSYHNFNTQASWNYDGVNYGLGANYNTYILFTNNWSLGAGIQLQGEKYSDVETRGNGIWEWPVSPSMAWWASFNTDRRKMFSLNLNPGSGEDRGGSWWAHYTGIEFRPKSNMEFELGMNIHRTFNATRWVSNESDSSLFADLDQDRITVHAGTSIVFNRNLTFQASAQALVSGLDYEGYRYYQGGNNYSVEQSGYNYDYNYSAINSTMLIRWEYSPGSALYVVWTRSRPEVNSGSNSLVLNRDFDRLFSAGAQNVFLVKASYWLNI